MVAIIMAFLAWLRGGYWERLMAGALCVGLVVSRMIPEGPHVTYSFLALDLTIFVVATIIALRSRLWWATWVAGLQLFAVSIHVARIVDPRVTIYAYFLGLGLCTYLVLLTVIVGTLNQPRSRPALSERLKDVFQARPAASSEIIAFVTFAALATAIAVSLMLPTPGAQ